MIKFLIKRFVPDYEDTKNPIIREKYSVLAGVLGLFCNVFLFLVKFFIGTLMGSIAIISDAFNNLSDTGTALISIIGAKLANKKPDREHPFGHGRFEYISSMIVAFIITLVGFELLKSSFLKIFNPEPIKTDTSMLLILFLSVLIKVWMYSYNKYIGRKISSNVLLAASKDSINDVVSTLAVIITTLLSSFVNIPFADGVIGVIVSIIIIISGVEIISSTISVLLGAPPSKETVENIKKIILENSHIAGVHDLIVHDYGPGRVMASVHAEVPDNSDIVEIHEVIDALEKKIENDMGIHIVIHMDPISVNCEITNNIKKDVLEIVKDINPQFDIHDFRMTQGVSNINLIFDLEVPSDIPQEGLLENISKLLHEKDKRYSTVINIDTIYE